jgi:hypothetical protein
MPSQPNIWKVGEIFYLQEMLGSCFHVDLCPPEFSIDWWKPQVASWLCSRVIQLIIWFNLILLWYSRRSDWNLRKPILSQKFWTLKLLLWISWNISSNQCVLTSICSLFSIKNIFKNSSMNIWNNSFIIIYRTCMTILQYLIRHSSV